MNEYMADFLRTASLIELQMLKRIHEGQHHSAIDRAIQQCRKVPRVNEWAELDHAWADKKRKLERQRHQQARVRKAAFPSPRSGRSRKAANLVARAA